MRRHKYLLQIAPKPWHCCGLRTHQHLLQEVLFVVARPSSGKDCSSGLPSLRELSWLFFPELNCWNPGFHSHCKCLSPPIKGLYSADVTAWARVKLLFSRSHSLILLSEILKTILSLNIKPMEAPNTQCCASHCGLAYSSELWLSYKCAVGQEGEEERIASLQCECPWNTVCYSIILLIYK